MAWAFGPDFLYPIDMMRTRGGMPFFFHARSGSLKSSHSIPAILGKGGIAAMFSRKMTRTKKLAISSVVLIAIGYISKPDRGGVWLCAKIFEMPELHQFHLSHRPFLMWEPFESSKFRFRILPSDFSRLDAALKLHGYPAWIKGGVTYGSVSHGWESDEDYIYCQSKRGGYSYTWSYSAKESLIYAIQFP